MKKLLVSLATTLTISLGAGTAQAQIPMPTPQAIGGDAGTACEVLLCLAGMALGTRPSQCIPPIRRYILIKATKPWKTFDMRHSFLKLCPASNQDSHMASWTRAIAAGGGACDAEGMNTDLKVTYYTGSGEDQNWVTVIDNNMPTYCSDIAAHPYINKYDWLPVYIGTPTRGGYWADPENVAVETVAYNARIKAEDEAAAVAAALQQQQNQGGEGGGN
jgi:TrbM